MFELLPIEGAKLYLFLAGSLAVLLMPGMAILYIVGISLDRGPWAGIVSSLGISLGGFVQVAGAALGVTLLLEASTLAPRVITYLGASYLIYLGIRRLKPVFDALAGEIDYSDLAELRLMFIAQNNLMTDEKNEETDM